MERRTRDAEAELNLPPGFRFHPTDEELVVHYLCRKVTCQILPVPIIAEVDLYKYCPWQLPEKALFGNKEWYFFTPRDRKYPNGSRPNRSAGSGYWKATGADKPVFPHGSSRPLGIKKALVFYNGKAPKGIKTDWIMHEYRLADTNRSVKRNGSLRLDDWVLCRLYNKKNNWGMMKMKTEEENFSEIMQSDTASDCVRTPESDVEHDALPEMMKCNSEHATNMFQQSKSVAPVVERMKEDSDWFMDLKLDDLQGSIGGLIGGTAAGFDGVQNQDYCFSALESPSVKWNQMNMTPFCN